jgi:hypothetical protein
MEVPGIAPGSANPSPSVSTCVFEDPVSMKAGLLDGPQSSSRTWLAPSRLRNQRPVSETSPNYRRSRGRLGRAVQGTGHASYAARAKLSLAIVFFPGVSRGSGKPRHATSGSENASNLVHPPHFQSAAPERTRGLPKQPSRTYDTNLASWFRQSIRFVRRQPLTAFRQTEYTPPS